MTERAGHNCRACETVFSLLSVLNARAWPPVFGDAPLTCTKHILTPVSCRTHGFEVRMHVVQQQEHFRNGLLLWTLQRHELPSTAWLRCWQVLSVSCFIWDRSSSCVQPPNGTFWSWRRLCRSSSSPSAALANRSNSSVHAANTNTTRSRRTTLRSPSLSTQRSSRYACFLSKPPTQARALAE